MKIASLSNAILVFYKDRFNNTKFITAFGTKETFLYFL